ncbi:MAG: hypothetical protein ABR549_11590 [Mycobacteriales bacterium]
MRVTGPDEQFTHQVPLPHVMVGSSDPSWRERYWVSFQDTQGGDTVLTLGLGQYPNQDVMEAFAVLSQGGRQHNLRLSRTLLPNAHDMAVGPLRVDVQEPLRSLRFTLDDNDSGVRFDLEWRAQMEAVLEEPFFQVSRARATYDAIRYVQHGRASGSLHVPGLGDVAVTPDRWWAERDHSWGTRPLPRTPGMPPGERPPWRFLLFAPLQLQDFAVHLYLQESAPGRPVYLTATLTGPIGADIPQPDVLSVEHDLVFEPGAATITLREGELRLLLDDGSKLDLQLRALPGRAHLRGGGYEGWNGWFQGQWRGELTSECDVWDLTDAGQLYRYAKAGSDHLVEVTAAGQTGYGIVEYMVLPGYGRYEEALPPRPER